MRIFIQQHPEQRNDSADIVCNIEQLASIPAAVATEILCEDAADYSNNRVETLSNIISKLRYGGRLIITGVDINEVSREVLNKNISIDDAAALLYGGRQSVSSALKMRELFTSFGLEVVNCRIKNLHYYILAKRNAAV